MKRVSVLDLIRKSKSYNFALFTTFNFDINFFEGNILNKLYDNGVRNVSVFVDSKEFVKSLEDVENSSIGKRYLVTPVNLNSSFHPKVILLLGKKKARLIIGSNNLTTSGYYINNEVVNYFDYEPNKTEYLNLIRDAVKFFELVNEKTDKRDADLIKKIKALNYLNSDLDNDVNQNFFIHNINESIISQVKSKIDGEVTSVDIAVPYYDNELSCLNEIQKMFSDVKCELYIQNNTSSFPQKYKDKYNIHLFSGFNDSSQSHFYHGKVFRFNTSDKSYILYGSANCTLAAMINSNNAGGNIEANILSIGEKDEYNYYFENFKLENKEFKSNLIIHNTEEYNPFLYLNNDGNYELIFKCSDKTINLNELDVIINNKHVNKKLDNDILIVMLNIELLIELDSIFNVSFKYRDKEYNVKCYINDMEQIRYNRISFNSAKKLNINVSPDIDSLSENYIAERRELLSKTYLLYEADDEDEYKDDIEKGIYNGEDINQYEVGENEEDFIIRDEDIFETDERKHAIDMIKKANNHIYSSFKNYCFDKKSTKEHTANSIKKDETEKSNLIIHRRATSEEKRFGRFVLNEAKNLSYVIEKGNKDFKTYFECTIAIFEVFNRFIVREKVDDMFKEDEAFNCQYNLIDKLYQRINTNEVNEDSEMYIIILLVNIIQMRKNENQKIKIRNSSLLKRIDKKLNIRDNIENYLDKAIAALNENEGSLDKAGIKKYIDGVFGYKTKKELYSIIKNKYGIDAYIEEAGDEFIIISSTDMINKYFIPDKNIIDEIIKYLNNTESGISKINILVKNLKKDYPKGSNPVIFSVIKINVRNNKTDCTQIRKKDVGNNQLYLDASEMYNKMESATE